MRILVITDEVWNDNIHGNNVLSNWFNGFDAEFANIYCSPGLPHNNCCDKYFQITDRMMLNSILKCKKAGSIVQKKTINSLKTYNSTDLNVGFIRKYFPNILRMLKEIVWKYGRYDIELMQQFLKEFNPDIIFSIRFAKRKILRLENIVQTICNCPIVAFTGDDEYSLKMFSFSPFAWYNKFIQRHSLKKMFNKYSLYYTLSDEQKSEYEKILKCPVKILRKCADVSKDFFFRSSSKPIKIVYAGKIYCNRWKTLLEVSKAVAKIDPTGENVQFHLYTPDKLSNKIYNQLNNGISSFVHAAVSSEKLQQIYSESDIVLHVESFDIRNRLLTRVSFSTKIIDCLKSGCAVMAICWEKHSGFTYLKKEDAAICVCNTDAIYNSIKKLVTNFDLLDEYRRKAHSCALRNHIRQDVQSMIYNDFNAIIEAHKTQS